MEEVSVAQTQPPDRCVEPGVREAQETPARPVWAARLMLVLQYSSPGHSGRFTRTADSEQGHPPPPRPTACPPWAHGTGVLCLETPPPESPALDLQRSVCSCGPRPLTHGPSPDCSGSELRLLVPPTPERARVHVRSWVDTISGAWAQGEGHGGAPAVQETQALGPHTSVVDELPTTWTGGILLAEGRGHRGRDGCGVPGATSILGNGPVTRASCPLPGLSPLGRPDALHVTGSSARQLKVAVRGGGAHATPHGAWKQPPPARGPGATVAPAAGSSLCPGQRTSPRGPREDKPRPPLAAGPGRTARVNRKPQT